MSLQRWPLGFADSPSYAAPLTPWASFPPASTVEGQIRRPEELPHVSLIALGGIWRPLGGRQVLKARYINPVTIQDLTANGVLVERIGPFPGGLVRAGMSLSMTLKFSHPGVGNFNRGVWLRAGAANAVLDQSRSFSSVSSAVTNTTAAGVMIGSLDVLSDISASHRGYLNGNVGLTFSSAIHPLTVDFSQPWDAAIYAQSGAENAITITGASWIAGQAGYFTSAAHGYAIGDKVTVAGITPTGYNGTFIIVDVLDSTTIVVDMPVDPGAWVSGGTSARISPVTSQSYSLELWG